MDHFFGGSGGHPTKLAINRGGKYGYTHPRPTFTSGGVLFLLPGIGAQVQTSRGMRDAAERPQESVLRTTKSIPRQVVLGDSGPQKVERLPIHGERGGIYRCSFYLVVGVWVKTSSNKPWKVTYRILYSLGIQSYRTSGTVRTEAL